MLMKSQNIKLETLLSLNTTAVDLDELRNQLSKNTSF